MTDRELHELRGSVKAYSDEASYPDDTATDGQRTRGLEHHIEFNAEGYFLIRRFCNSDGSLWVMRYTYSASGQLLRTVSGNNDEATTETVYAYDEHGRLLSIADSGSTAPIVFHYDERGRKTKVQVSRPADFRPNLGSAGSPFECVDRAPNLPGGGSATTIYDEHDRAVKVEVRDSHDEIVNRAVRIYDQQGRIAEEQQILDSPETIIPAESRTRILEESGVSLQELRRQLSELMAGHAGPYSIAYKYDAQDRVTQKLRRFFNEEELIETSYNQQGDIATETTRGRIIGKQEPGTPGCRAPVYSDARYSYEYDAHQNWVKRIVLSRSNPNDPFRTSSEHRRTLSYY